MSKLLEKLEELKVLQKKVDCLKALEKVISKFSVEEFKDVQAEMQNILVKFIDSQISSIESVGSTEDAKESVELKNSLETSFSKEDLSILKLLVDKANNLKGDAPEITKPAPKVDRTRGDKIAFALQYRHLDGKDVKVRVNEESVSGKVVGIDAPHIIVKTATGHTVPVELENLIV